MIFKWGAMMNFFVNEAMGLGNSGVEHAQFYRGKLFDMAKIPYRYIFVGLVRELHEAMAAWNLRDDQVINMWEYFVFEEKYLNHGPIHKQAATSVMAIDGTNTNRTFTYKTTSGMTVIEHMVKFPDPKNTNMLLVSTARVEIFDSQTYERKVMYSYYDDPQQGSVMTNIHLFNFHGKHEFFPNQVQLTKFFFNAINQAYPEKNTFIIDRGEENEAALFKLREQGFNIVELVHADHLADRNDPKHPLWNNYYEYMIQHLEYVDRVVVATKLQREDFLIDFPQYVDKFVAIPVGGIRDTTFTPKKVARDKKAPFKFVSVSRLADEKHIDLCIRAIKILHDNGHEVALDIYGQGEKQKMLADLITELQATAYIKMCGHSNRVDEVYPKYDAFISGSFSEGFGLTYIEALNAQLPVLSYNARFGALELIHDGKNGFLAPFKRQDPEYSVAQLALAAEKMLAADYDKLVAQTRVSVMDFRDSVLAKKWEDLINAL